MLIAGARRLAALSPAIQAAPTHSTIKGSSSTQGYEYEGESLLPDFNAAPEVNFEIGVAVAQQAVLEGTASSEWARRSSGAGEDFADSEVRDLILEEVKTRAEEKVWVPVYRGYEYDPEGLTE